MSDNSKKIKEYLKQRYGKLHDSKGKGKKQIGGVEVKAFLKKVVDNRVLDVYLKYLGVKTLTTLTLVPFALILGKDMFEKYVMTKGQDGGHIPEDIPIVDHPLVGTVLKLSGISLLRLTPGTLIPLGVAMIIYDLLFGKKQEGGSRLITGNDIPMNTVQKFDQFFRGQEMSENVLNYPNRLPEINNSMNLQCQSGNCLPNDFSSHFDNSPFKADVNGFDKLGIPSTSNWTRWYGDIGEYKAEPIPYSMAGGKRRQRKSKGQKGSGSQWMASQYSRGPINNPDMDPSMFNAFTKTGQYMSNTELSAIPQIPQNTNLILDTPLSQIGLNSQVQGYNIAGIPTTKYGGKRKSKGQRGSGSQWMATQYSRGPINTPDMDPSQFNAFTKTGQYMTNSELTGMPQVPQNNLLMLDTPLSGVNNTNIAVTGYNIAGVPTVRYTGGKIKKTSKKSSKKSFNKRDLTKMYNKIMDAKNRVKVVNDLIQTQVRTSKKRISKRQVEHLKKQSKDKSVKNNQIIKHFSKDTLLKNLE